jgi:hypothetical protein
MLDTLLLLQSSCHSDNRQNLENEQCPHGLPCQGATVSVVRSLAETVGELAGQMREMVSTVL